ncbi:MAG: hypothetical protein ACR2LP_01380 [Candidatus Limnocylindrales bacterium]
MGRDAEMGHDGGPEEIGDLRPGEQVLNELDGTRVPPAGLIGCV